MNSVTRSETIDTLLDQSQQVERRYPLKCCCDSSKCPHLSYNNSISEGLERDLLSAAQIGQALLIQHENYMAKAEAERFRITTVLERLEGEKLELERANAETTEQNQSLLDELERLNDLVSGSDSEIQSLTAGLHSIRQDMQKLAVLAGRAVSLETMITNMEIEQTELHAQLVSGEETNRSAMQSWKRAEGTVVYLQDQISRIEREAKEERDRHAEVLERVRRRRTVEGELANMGSRQRELVPSPLEDNQYSDSVVSLFVKSILQDNANLQKGVVELRDILTESNTELEILREQQRIHQHFEDYECLQPALQNGLPTKWTMLKPQGQELESLLGTYTPHPRQSPESTPLRTKDIRLSIDSAQTLLASSNPTPKAQYMKDWSTREFADVATTFSQSLFPDFCVNHRSKCSMQSSHVTSPLVPSVTSSPRRASSIFDNIEAALESSRLTTPESSLSGSPEKSWTERENCKAAPYVLPRVNALHPKLSKISSAQKRGKSLFSMAEDGLGRPTKLDSPGLLASTIQSRVPWSYNNTLPPIKHGITGEWTKCAEIQPLRPDTYSESIEHPIRLASPSSTSEDRLSLLPSRDSHKLGERPSQIVRDPIPVYNSMDRAFSTHTEPISGSTPATGVAMFGKGVHDSGEYTRSLLNSLQRSTENKNTFERLMSDWVWGKRAIAPMTPPNKMRSKVDQAPFSVVLRSPGVNQQGQVWGLQGPIPTPSNVRPGDIDASLLRETLADM